MPALRLPLWAFGALSGATMFGIGWATQSVEVPVWALLTLTFVPLERIVDAIRSKLPEPKGESNAGN